MSEIKSLTTAAAYVRVSTDDQLEYSPDSQLKLIQDYARSHDMILMSDNIFMEEEGLSGRKASKRPEFQRMIGMAKQTPRPFDVILVWKFSRFARNQEESIVYKSMLRQKCGVDVISVSEPIIEGPFGSLIERIIEWMDEYYSIRLSGEVLRGMKERFSRGGILTKPSFGYLVEDNNYVPDPETAPLVRQIFEWFANDGLNYRAITTRLNTMGIKTNRGNPIEVRTIRYMLRNPVYIGKIRWSEGKKDWNVDSPDQAVVQGTHQPLISNELWEAAQKRYEDILLKHPQGTRTVKLPMLLQGLIKCSACGATITRIGGDGMQCINYSHGICTSSHHIKRKTLEEMVLSGIEQSFETANLVIVPRRKSSDDVEHQLIEQQLKREKNKLERIKAAYEEGVDTIEEYKAKKERISALIAELESKLAAAPAPAVISVADFIAAHAHLLVELRDPEKSDSEKNEILRGFVGKVIFNRTTGSIQIIFCN